MFSAAIAGVSVVHNRHRYLYVVAVHIGRRYRLKGMRVMITRVNKTFLILIFYMRMWYMLSGV